MQRSRRGRQLLPLRTWWRRNWRLPPSCRCRPRPPQPQHPIAASLLARFSQGRIAAFGWNSKCRIGSIYQPATGRAMSRCRLSTSSMGFRLTRPTGRVLGVQDRADALIASGQIKPLAIVMPRLPEPLFRSSDGGPWSYEAEMLEGLIPAIEGRIPGAVCGTSTGGGGKSRGGSVVPGDRHDPSGGLRGRGCPEPGALC